MHQIEFHSLSKSYGEFTALHPFSTKLEGSVIGLLGHNGAGKSTLLRMLTQIYQPTSGKITVNGEDLNPDHRQLFGYLPEDKGLYQDISLIDQLRYFAALKGVDKQVGETRIQEWLEKFELTLYAKKKTQHLSKGMQQKIQFIASIIHEPPVVVLDEPLSGLDPVNAQVINEYIATSKDRRQMVIFSTHRMEQAEDIADRIIMLNHGKKVIDGRIDQVKLEHFADQWRFGSHNFDALLNEINSRKIPIQSQNMRNTTVTLSLSSGDAQKLLISLTSKVELHTFQQVLPSLQEIFISYAS